jgi:putative PIN family toxin of toxin-antitoxin system
MCSVIRAVLDVNVIVSDLSAVVGNSADITTAWSAGRFELVVSEHVLNGTNRILHKPYFRARITPDEVQRNLDFLRAEATLVEPIDMDYGVADDEDDDLVLATTVAGQVPYLVTGD